MKLSVRDLGKSFGRKVVLRGVDLELEKGQAVCITGPNGAGKSTLIKILSTLLRPDRGEIRIDGENPFENPRIFRSCLLYTSPSPRDLSTSRMPSSA